MSSTIPSVVIGDVQGCAATLNQLLRICAEKLGHFDAYFVGDLVNRGGDSLSVLETVRAGGHETVLGNHELYVLGVIAGAMERKADTLDTLFDTAELTDWVEWLRHRPLLLELDDYIIVHAGVYPGWTRVQTLEYANRIEHGLRSTDWKGFLKGILGRDIKDRRTAEALQVFTRMRMLTGRRGLDTRFKGTPEAAPNGLTPWYEQYEAQMGRIIFGHWAALGAREWAHCVSLDSGCVWGRELTGYELTSRQFISCPVIKSDLTSH